MVILVVLSLLGGILRLLLGGAGFPLGLGVLRGLGCLGSHLAGGFPEGVHRLPDIRLQVLHALANDRELAQQKTLNGVNAAQSCGHAQDRQHKAAKISTDAAGVDDDAHDHAQQLDRQISRTGNCQTYQQAVGVPAGPLKGGQRTDNRHQDQHNGGQPVESHYADSAEYAGPADMEEPAQRGKQRAKRQSAAHGHTDGGKDGQDNAVPGVAAGRRRRHG